MLTPQAETKLQEVSNKYIPLLDKAIDEGYAQLARNRNKRVFRALKAIGIEDVKVNDVFCSNKTFYLPFENEYVGKKLRN